MGALAGLILPNSATFGCRNWSNSAAGVDESAGVDKGAGVDPCVLRRPPFLTVHAGVDEGLLWHPRLLVFHCLLWLVYFGPAVDDKLPA